MVLGRSGYQPGMRQPPYRRLRANTTTCQARISVVFRFGNIVITLVILLVGMAASVQAQNLSFTLREHLVIGDDEGASAEYLFTYPELVRTDSEDNIYVRDDRRADIRVFNARGQYVTTIGKRGEGPGEMREIFGMHVDTQDRLIVADRMSRRFTIFTNLGNSFEIRAFEESRTISPDPILSLGDSFVLRYLNPIYDPEGGPGIRDDKVLHLHDNQLNWLETLAPLGEIFDLSRPFLNAYSDSPGAVKVATNGTDTIVLAPKVNSGYVYRYRRSNNIWVMDKLKGSPAPDRAFMPVSKSDYENNQELSRPAIMTSGRSGTYFARIFNWSRGIFFRSNGDIVNFVTHTPLRKALEKKAELFDKDGVLLGYGPLRLDAPGLNSNNDIVNSVTVLWIDSADRIYIRRRNEHGFYILSVAELVIKKS